MRCNTARIWAGSAGACTAIGVGSRAGSGAACGICTISLRIGRPFFGTDGDISARSTLASPQIGHSSKPRLACFSKLALSLNQPSKPCSALHWSW
jgi:hypothetical protein